MGSALDVHRLHFAFTITFHYLFPQLTMGLALLIVILKTIALGTGDEHYNRSARFWAKIFGINFAFGVVTGIPMEFQFGTNWAEFSKTAGGVIGQTLAMEGIFSFFLESSFLGLFLYGEKRLGRVGHWLAALLVFIGSWLSGYFIIATDAWMQHPTGYRVLPDGQIGLASFWGLLLNPWALGQYAHNMLGAVVLWLLILRGSAVEFRNHIQSPIWIPFWDFFFSASSLLLAVFFGTALGNVIRGVPLDESGYFFEPLWTNLRLGEHTGILDWYTILVGVTALLALMMHGALWVQLKTGGAVRERSQRLAGWAWWGVLGFTALLTAVTFSVQPQVLANFRTLPAGYVLPALAIAGLAGVQFELRRSSELHAFLASCGYLLGMLTSAVFGVYPMVLPARNPLYSLTVTNAKAGAYGLKIGLVWWVIGISLAAGYFIYVYRTFAGKVATDAEPHSL